MPPVDFSLAMPDHHVILGNAHRFELRSVQNVPHRIAGAEDTAPVQSVCRALRIESRSRRLTIAPTALGLRRWRFARPMPKWVLQAVSHRFEYRPALLHGVI